MVIPTLVTLLGMLVMVVPFQLSFARARDYAGTAATSARPPASGSATARSCTSWQIVASPNTSGISNILSGVAVVGPNDAWAVGYGEFSGGLVLHWDGSQWKLSSTPVSGHRVGLSGIAALSSDDIWAVGGIVPSSNAAQATLTLHWDGSTWTVVPSPNVAGVDNSLDAIAALAPNDIWAVGHTTSSAYLESTLAMHWDGSAWTIVSTPNTGDIDNIFDSVAAISTNDVWAVGEVVGHVNGQVKGDTLADHWDGSKWSVVASPDGSPYGAQLLGVTALAANDVWAVGGTLATSSDPATHSLVEHWTGNAWQIVPSPDQLTDNVLYGVAVVPGTHQLWAVGSTSNGTIGTGNSLIEQWNGTSWTLSAAADPKGGDATLNAVAANASSVWAVGTNNANDNLTLIESHSRLLLGIACP